MAGFDRWLEEHGIDPEAGKPEAEEELEAAEAVEEAPEPEPSKPSTRHDVIPQDRPVQEAPDHGTVWTRPRGGGRYTLDAQGNRVRVEEPTSGG